MRLTSKEVDTALSTLESKASTNNTRKKVIRGLISKGIVNKLVRVYQDEKGFVIRDYDKLRTIRTGKGFITSFLKAKFGFDFDKAWVEDVPALIEEYEPTKDIGIAKDDMTINICHTPNIDKRIKPTLDIVKIPKHFKILLNNVVPEKVEQEYFLHWLANSLQLNTNRVAIISQGSVEGTGKGLFFNEFVKWAFSDENVSEVLMRNIKSQFNSALDNKLFVVMNEIKFTEKENNAQEEVKAWITDDTNQVEGKGRDSKTRKRLMSFWLHTNQDEMMVLKQQDRRFNVFLTAQKKLLNIIDVEVLVKHLKKERVLLLEQLLSLKVDQKLISIPLQTQAKIEVIQASTGTHIEFAKLLKKGEMFSIVEYATAQFNRPKTERQQADSVSLLRGTTLPDLLSKLEYELADKKRVSVSLLHHLHCLLFDATGIRVMNRLYSDTLGSKSKTFKRGGNTYKGFQL